MTRHALFAVVIALLLATAACADPVELSNDHLTISLDPDDGYAVSSIVNRAADVNFIAPRPEGVEQDRSPWAVAVRMPSGVARTMTAADATSASHALEGDTLTVTWEGVRNDDTQANLTVAMQVSLPDDSVKAFWTVTVSGETAGALWRVDCPRVFGVRSMGDDQMCVPYHWGRLVRDPTHGAMARTLPCPQPASMQFFAYWGTEDARSPELEAEEGSVSVTGWSPDRSDAAGLYWGSEDGEFYWKNFHYDGGGVDGQLLWWIENVPSIEDWPVTADTPQPVNYTPPYRNVVAVFTGDWHEAAALYGEWAREQLWSRRGTADDWPDETPAPGSDELTQWVPNWFREIGFWAKFYHEPAKILPEWAAYRKWLRVPIASHWYRSKIARFNDNDPENFPLDPYVLEGARDAKALGVRPLPYVLSTIWDTDTQSWIREHGIESTMTDEGGKYYPWLIGDQMFAWMCPYPEQWRAKMREVCGKCIVEHGMSGVYLDVLACGRSRGCYNPAHGHPVHGGNYQFTGNRRLMSELRAEVRRLKPDAAFFTECIDEVFNDLMDGYLTLDLTRGYMASREQVWPIFTAVYHQYAINFGSDANLSMDPDTFAVIYGRQFIWGSQLLNSSVVAKLPEEGDPTSEMFRDITQAYHVAGRRFLMGGEWTRLAVRPKDAPAGNCGLELAADGAVIRYVGNRADRKRIWSGPAVMASAWKRDGDLGIVMVNVTGDEQTVELAVRPEPLRLTAAARLVRTWPLDPESVGEAAGAHDLTLAPRTAAIYVITTDVDRAMQVNELEDTPWELLMADDGPFESVEGPAGSLWACSDGPVVNATSEQGTEATPYCFNENGSLQPRVGHQAEVRGAAAEGQPLPRDLDAQPFALMRRLPHTVSGVGRGVLVLSGDEQCLSCVAPPGAKLTFSAPGLVIVTSADTGQIFHELGEDPTDTVTIPEQEGGYLVGYARFEPAEMEGLLAFGDEEFAARLRPLADRLLGLSDAPPDQRAADLAAASREFVALVGTLGDEPGALAPDAPLSRLHDRMSALVCAQLGGQMQIWARHRWLAPDVTKRITVMIHNDAGLFEDLTAIEVLPVGGWAEGGLQVAGEGDIYEVRKAARAFRPALTLYDGLYVERMIPVVACARTSRGDQEYCLTEILRLEANRPYEIKTPLRAVDVVAGAGASAEVKLRNWSPEDVRVSFVGSGPEGWRVEPQPAELTASGLTYSKLEVLVTPPADTPRGRYEVTLTANHSDGPETEVYGIIAVNVLDARVPFAADGDWALPEPDELAVIRRSGTFALYAEEGEAVRIRLDNVRVTRYVDTLAWELHAPDMSVHSSGSVKVDEAHEIEFDAPVTGTYYLSVTPKAGSVVVETDNRYLCELATPEAPLQLFTCNIARWFHVPAGSKGFAIGGRDGGATETAHVVITSPTGRVAYDYDGNYQGADSPVQVNADEAGKVWTITIEPVQDIELWLTGDVWPYLATSAERVLAPAGN
jgi:hypothetical protein